ncbi:hypothetical protein [Vitiosangium sp. GDMCC 1.1324]|uniref:hypothetical protein n=1 Tax=Vitiosangium sp. (strain GDMCC 1.1324) TaxID=2138576 RepID=UPI000D3C75D0|nr:hypothetical protein [Vitiosangium sp. GDMCC 1.1324]PTL79299.1 hypothetical protein DAT35_34415 [Vitiosangium sp. GDMCC 1.1324]
MSTASRRNSWSRLQVRPLGLLLSMLLALLLSGCLPTPIIHQFSTTPPVACPGDEVTLRWETNGPVRIEATPEVPTLGRKRDTGTQKVTISGPTRFHLEVYRVFGLKKELTESEVLSPPKDLEYGVVDAEGQSHFTCSTQTGALESSFQLDDSHISPNVRVGQVTNMNVRPLVISKGDVSETVGEGAKAPGFEGQPAQGLWRLRVPLDEGESCEDALESVDGRLIIKFQLSCPR